MSAACNGLSRRHLIAGAAAALTYVGKTASAAPFCTDVDSIADAPLAASPPLGSISTRVAWGVAIEPPALYDAALVRTLAAEKPRLLAIASALKFGDVYPTEAAFTDGGLWSVCDDTATLAARLGVPLRGDALTWNDWLPDWLTAIQREKRRGWQARLRTALSTHIAGVFAHLRRLQRAPDAARMRWAGVVNEPFHPWLKDQGLAAYRPGPWLDAFGYAPDGVPAYIHAAFELAGRHAPPDVALFLNEAHCENDHFGPIVRPRILALVDALQTAGRRLDAVGLECHLMPQWMHDPEHPDWTAFRAFLQDLASRGLKIYITELDVMDCLARGVPARDALVARYVGSFCEACLRVPVVTMITTWDFSDRYSWLRGEAVYPSLSAWAGCPADPPCPRPDLYDQKLEPKPARARLAESLAQHAR